jgi:hypothetical protein
MTERPKTLPEIQKECRRLAAEIGDPKVAEILRSLADDLERHVGKANGKTASPMRPKS